MHVCIPNHAYLFATEARNDRMNESRHVDMPFAATSQSRPDSSLDITTKPKPPSLHQKQQQERATIRIKHVCSTCVSGENVYAPG